MNRTRLEIKDMFSSIIGPVQRKRNFCGRCEDLLPRLPPALAAVYKIVLALVHAPRSAWHYPRDPKLGLTPQDLLEIKLDEIFPYIDPGMGTKSYEHAKETIELAVRDRFSLANEDGTYRFVVPEVGYLLTALAVLAPQHPRRWLHYARGWLKENSSDPIRQMALIRGAWHQEQMLLRS